jgi:hypothetical protein
MIDSNRLSVFVALLSSSYDSVGRSVGRSNGETHDVDVD